MAELSTLCIGIHESGLILQTALRAAFEDIRGRAPYLLDYCFHQLKADSLLSRDYGAAEVERAKKWFMDTDIPVFNTARKNTAKFPCVSLKVLSSNEDEASLADINSDPYEDANPAWPILAGPFDAISYDPKTGTLTTPDPGIVTGIGQMVVTRTGNAYQVQSTPTTTTFVIAPKLQDDFAQMTIRGPQNAFITSLESVEFAETYMIGCHAPGEAAYASYLHSIVKFCLLMYKQSLLERRNFERSLISSTAEGEQEQQIDSGEIVYSRYIQISGFVRCSWPKNISPKITAFEFQPRIAGAGKVLTNSIDSDDVAWLGDEDPLAGN